MVEDAGNDIDIVGVGASEYKNKTGKKALANMMLAVLIPRTALTVNKNKNKNKNPKAYSRRLKSLLGYRTFISSISMSTSLI